MTKTVLLQRGAGLLVVLLLAACSSTVPPSNAKSNARLTPSTDVTRALIQLPEPKAKIAVAVYGLRDQTGQYRPSPDSVYSTAVTQGAATMLVDALRDSGWYIPVEREGLQNLLTERRIVRAIESPTDKGKAVINLPNLMPASLIIEGGIIAYETNVRTGGKGANFLGIGANTQYRVDQVTVGLRSVDIRTGQVLNTVSVTKTIYSYQFNTNIYKFVSYQQLLQGETGFTTNEPAQLAVREAIESAVVHLTVQGVRERYLELKNEQDWNTPVIQTYLRENARNLREDGTVDEELIPMQALNGEAPPPVVRPLAATVTEVVSKPAVEASKPVADAASVATQAAAVMMPFVPQPTPAPVVAPVVPKVLTPEPVVTAKAAVAPPLAVAAKKSLGKNVPANKKLAAPQTAASPQSMPDSKPVAEPLLSRPVSSVQPALAPVPFTAAAPVATPVATPNVQAIGNVAGKKSGSAPTDDIFKQYWGK